MRSIGSAIYIIYFVTNFHFLHPHWAITVTLFSSSPDQYLLVSNAIGWQVYISDLFADRTVRRRLNGLPKRDDEGLDPQVPISMNLKTWNYREVDYSNCKNSMLIRKYNSLFVNVFEMLFWSWSAESRTLIKRRFNSNIIGHIIESTLFYSQSKTTSTSFSMRWQQSQNYCKLDGKHIHDCWCWSCFERLLR